MTHGNDTRASFLRDLRTLVGREHLAWPARERQEFIERVREHLEIVHHELMHAAVPRDVILSERSLFGPETSEIRGVREAFVEAAARRGFMPFMRDCRALALDWRLGQGERRVEMYPAHVAALESLMDHLAAGGTSHERVIHDSMQLGTSRRAMEHLCDLLYGPGAKADVHGRANLRRDAMAGFSKLTANLEEINRSSDRTTVAALRRQLPASGPALAGDLLRNADARAREFTAYQDRWAKRPPAMRLELGQAQIG